MGYFDAVASGSFKKNAEGRTVFYPLGIFGAGRIVPTIADELLLRKTLVRHLQVMVFVTPPLAIASPWLVLLLIPVGVGFEIWIRRATSEWERTATRLGLRESLIAQAKRHSVPTLWLMLFGSLILMVGSTLAFVRGNPRDLVIGTVGVVFCGLCGFVFATMILLRSSNPTDPE
jgi:hypothetical protein